MVEMYQSSCHFSGAHFLIKIIFFFLHPISMKKKLGNKFEVEFIFFIRHCPALRRRARRSEPRRTVGALDHLAVGLWGRASAPVCAPRPAFAGSARGACTHRSRVAVETARNDVVVAPHARDNGLHRVLSAPRKRARQNAAPGSFGPCMGSW